MYQSTGDWISVPSRKVQLSTKHLPCLQKAIKVALPRRLYSCIFLVPHPATRPKTCCFNRLIRTKSHISTLPTICFPPRSCCTRVLPCTAPPPHSPQFGFRWLCQFSITVPVPLTTPRLFELADVFHGSVCQGLFRCATEFVA